MDMEYMEYMEVVKEVLLEVIVNSHFPHPTAGKLEKEEEENNLMGTLQLEENLEVEEYTYQYPEYDLGKVTSYNRHSMK